ncbi:MAG: dienelactone hydrolase family protein [Pseudomonadota bacterium]
MDKAKFINLLGDLPVKAPLNLEIIEDQDCGSYTRKKILFSSESNERISAYLCIPNDSKMMAAIYCFHQHAGNYLLGKSEVVGIRGDKSLAYAHELAELGFVTLSPDAIGFEERAGTKDPRFFHLNNLHERLLKNQTLLGKVLFDVSAGIDLLRSLREVDSKKIGFIGHSYGGRTALFAPAFDDRIKVSVSNCGSTFYKDMIEAKTGIQFDYVVPNILKYGDIDSVINLFTNTDLLVLGADDDKWSLSLLKIEDKCSHRFVKNELKIKTFEGKHEFPSNIRLEAYEFLKKSLN